MPRVKRPYARRQELLDAAIRVFVERGIAGATVDDVVAAAGAAKGTFYLYFRSKDELVAALGEAFALDTVAAMEAAAAVQPNRTTRLAAIVVTALTFYRDHAALHDALYHTATGHGGRHADFADSPVVRLFTRLIQDGIAAGDFAVADPELTALLLFAAGHAAVDHYLATGRQDWPRYEAAATELVTRTVQRPAPPAPPPPRGSGVP